MNQIEQFERAYLAYRQMTTEKWRRAKIVENLNKQLNERDWRKFFGKKKYDYSKLVEHPQVKPRIERWKSKVCLKWGDYWTAREKKAEINLLKLAENCEIPKSNDFIHVDTKESYSWSTQGYGAVRYAQGAAKLVVDKLAHYGIESEIRTVNEGSHGQYAIQHADFQIWAKTTEIGWQIFKRKPDLSLKEIVRFMLKQGCNPFVSFPFLPRDFLEKEGLDWFGQAMAGIC